MHTNLGEMRLTNNIMTNSGPGIKLTPFSVKIGAQFILRVYTIVSLNFVFIDRG